MCRGAILGLACLCLLFTWADAALALRWLESFTAPPTQCMQGAEPGYVHMVNRGHKLVSVRLLEDGNPVVGGSVTFTADRGAWQLTNPPSATITVTTQAGGYAQATWTPQDAEGPYIVRLQASSEGADTLTLDSHVGRWDAEVRVQSGQGVKDEDRGALSQVSMVRDEQGTPVYQPGSDHTCYGYFEVWGYWQSVDPERYGPTVGQVYVGGKSSAHLQVTWQTGNKGMVAYSNARVRGPGMPPAFQTQTATVEWNGTQPTSPIDSGPFSGGKLYEIPAGPQPSIRVVEQIYARSESHVDSPQAGIVSALTWGRALILTEF